MKFHVNRDVFSEAVSFVVKLLPQRNPQPILAGVLIEATEDGLSLAAFDYEASARTTIEATVDEPGTILVHGRLLSEIASRLPSAPIQIEVGADDGIVLLDGSSAGSKRHRSDAAAGLIADAASGTLVTEVAKTFDLRDAGQALGELGRSHPRGKFILLP